MLDAEQENILARRNKKIIIPPVSSASETEQISQGSGVWNPDACLGLLPASLLVAASCLQPEWGTPHKSPKWVPKRRSLNKSQMNKSVQPNGIPHKSL